MQDYEVIEFTDQIEYKKEFLALPKRLYKKREIMQNEEEEKQILENKHILSKYFKIHRFLVLNKRKKAVARAIVTFYENDDKAYIGFFECIRNYDISNYFLDYIERFIKRNGYKGIIGPLNCSFWIGYRFKLNNFSKPYFGEPYNKEYYPKMFEKAGYNVLQEYCSNIFSKVSKNQKNSVYTNRLKTLKDKGYEFKEPTEENFYEQLIQIGKMILNLYSDFPCYKSISEDDFFKMYKDLKKIVDYSMIKLAYYNNQMVGFFVSIPNYHNYINRKKYISILIKKMIKKEYILMYLGVDKNHLGLGRALAEEIKEELKAKRASSIGALIKKGNANRAYFKELITREDNYILYEKIFN